MLKKSSLFVCLLLLISSCSDNNETKIERELYEYVSASIRENSDVIAFGSMEIKEIIDKTDYQKIQMLNSIIAPESAALNSVFGMDTPVYFIVEGPISRQGSPKRVTIFMKVKNPDDLAKELEEERGFLVESQGDIRYAEDNEFILGFRDDLAIAIIQSEEFDAGKLIEEAFLATQGEMSIGKQHKILQAKGDFVIGMNLESLYETSNTSLAQLNDTKQLELEKMTKGSFTQTIVNFNKGNLSVESNNYFSDELKDAMFFSAEKPLKMKSLLSKGKDGAKIVGGFSSNIDITKMEEFYTSYAPDVIEMLNDVTGGLYRFVGAGTVLSKLISGNLGVLALASEDSKDFADGVRVFLGSSEAGKKAFMLMRSEFDMPTGTEFDYVDEGIEILLPMSGHNLNEIKGEKKLKMPHGAEGFGSDGLCGFLNFDQLTYMGLSAEEASILDRFDYARLEGGNDGMKFVLQMKNTNDNFLKQMTQLAMSMVPLLMGGMSL